MAKEKEPVGRVVIMGEGQPERLILREIENVNKDRTRQNVNKDRTRRRELR